MNLLICSVFPHCSVDVHLRFFICEVAAGITAIPMPICDSGAGAVAASTEYKVLARGAASTKLFLALEGVIATAQLL